MSKVQPFLCRPCLKEFASLQAFDDHRTGTHEPDTRRCLGLAEMMNQGQRMDPEGVWSVKTPKHLLTV